MQGGECRSTDNSDQEEGMQEVDAMLEELNNDLAYLRSRIEAVGNKRARLLARRAPMNKIPIELLVRTFELGSYRDLLFAPTAEVKVTLRQLESLIVGHVDTGLAQGLLEPIGTPFRPDKLDMCYNTVRRLLRLAFAYMPFMLLHPDPALAAFTRDASYRYDNIELSRTGARCWRPGPEALPPHACSDPALVSALKAHIENQRGSGLTIQYYDHGDGFALGGASWSSWNDTMLPVIVCLAGRVDGINEQAYRTTCYLSSEDNDFASRTAHATECTVDKPQRRVTDGCYDPPETGVFNLSAQATSILTVFGFILAVLSCTFFAWLGRWLWRRWHGTNQPVPADDGASARLLPGSPITSSTSPTLISPSPVLPTTT